VKRTAMAHVLFNAITGVTALVLLGPLAYLARWTGGYMGDDAVLTLAAFHTLFNLAGVLLFFPWLGAFARLIEKMTGKRDISSIARLDRTLSSAGGSVALESAWRALVELSATALQAVQARSEGRKMVIPDLQSDLHKLSDFIHDLRFEATDPQAMSDRRARLWHALDHLRRLSNDLAKPVRKISDAQFQEALKQAKNAIDLWLAWAAGNSPDLGDATVTELKNASANIASSRKACRVQWFDQLGAGRIRPDEAITALDGLRWFNGAYYHAWRLADSLWQAAEKGSAEGL
jgi:phosphate:Na+ symporter